MVESTKLIGLFLAEMTCCHCEQSCGISDFFFDTIEQLLPSTTASSLQNKNYGRVHSAPTSDSRIWQVNSVVIRVCKLNMVHFHIHMIMTIIMNKYGL